MFVVGINHDTTLNWAENKKNGFAKTKLDRGKIFFLLGRKDPCVAFLDDDNYPSIVYSYRDLAGARVPDFSSSSENRERV